MPVQTALLHPCGHLLLKNKPRLARFRGSPGSPMTMERDDDQLLALLAMELPGDRRGGNSPGTTEIDSDSSERTTPRDETDDADAGATVASEEDPYFVRMKRNWWKDAHGVIDTTPWGHGADASAGKVFEYCTYTIGRIVGSAGGPGSTKFKVGVAGDPFTRWTMYCEHDAMRFTHMFMLHRTDTREAANYLEAGLIAHLWCSTGCVNKERRDKGGTGPNRTSDDASWVYVIARRDAPSTAHRSQDRH